MELMEQRDILDHPQISISLLTIMVTFSLRSSVVSVSFTKMQELSFLAEKAPPFLSNLGGMLRSWEIDNHLCMLWFGLVPRFNVRSASMAWESNRHTMMSSMVDKSAQQTWTGQNTQTERQMAKAGVGAKPKLSFREQGEAKPEISTTSIHAQKQVRESFCGIRDNRAII